MEQAIKLQAWQNDWMLIGWEEYNYFINCTVVKHKCEIKFP
jgi:hypothetical protein